MYGIKTSAIVFYVTHTGVHAAYAAAGAGLGYLALHLDGLGLDPSLAVLVGGFLGTLASRIQAKNAPDSPANLPPKP